MRTTIEAKRVTVVKTTVIQCDECGKQIPETDRLPNGWYMITGYYVAFPEHHHACSDVCAVAFFGGVIPSNEEEENTRTVTDHKFLPALVSGEDMCTYSWRVESERTYCQRPEREHQPRLDSTRATREMEV